MIINRYKEKLYEAILYFATNTQYCAKSKLIKLLYLLDFEHYRQTGRSVTNLKYYAWEKGPVPIDLYEEFDDPSDEFLEVVHVERTLIGGKSTELTKPNREPHLDIFTPRELKLLKHLSDKYKDTTANKMIDVTHQENHAWDRTYRGGKGKNKHIQYDLAIDEEEFDAVRELAEERENFLEVLSE